MGNGPQISQRFLLKRTVGISPNSSSTQLRNPKYSEQAMSRKLQLPPEEAPQLIDSCMLPAMEFLDLAFSHKGLVSVYKGCDIGMGKKNPIRQLQALPKLEAG